MSNLKDFPRIPDGKYFFFIGAKQSTIPKSLVFASNSTQTQWIEIASSGKNALDFHIAYQIAKHDDEKNALHYILSKDKGFDPLISSINKQKNAKIVRRIVSLDDFLMELGDADMSDNATAGSAGALSASGQNEGSSDNAAKKTKKRPASPRERYDKEKFDRVLKNLTGIAKSARPKSEKTLKSHILTFATGENWTDSDVQAIVNELYREGIISKGAGSRISYSK